MRKMRFDQKQNDITIVSPESGLTDVIVLTNETAVTEKDGMPESEGGTISYEYDGNIFRTYKEITDDMIRADLNHYLNYDGDEKPTDKMVKYANNAVDEYTLRLMEEGVI